MKNPLDVPPGLESLIEKRDIADRRASDRRRDRPDENDDTQGAEASTEVQATEIDRRQAARRKKPRRDDD